MENRVRNIAGDYRGPVAIHAARAIDFAAADSMQLRLAWHEAFLPERKLDGGFAEPIFRELPDEDAPWMPTGAIVGMVDLVDAHLCVGECSPWALPTMQEPLRRDWWHLELANPRALAEPIPFRGALGLRRLDDDMVHRLVEAIA